MSEPATEPTAPAAPDPIPTEPTEPKPTETVDHWKSQSREWEKRAKANADAAKRLAEIENSQKSEAERNADRIKQLENDAAEARREALRFKVASKHGISAEDADLFLTGSNEETLTKQAERLKDRTPAVTSFEHGTRTPAAAQSGNDHMNARIRRAAGRE